MSTAVSDVQHEYFQKLTLHSNCTAIHDLQNEILVHIFSFLSIKDRFRIEKVCRCWREISQNAICNWPSEIHFTQLKKVDFETIPLTDKIASVLLSRCGMSVKRLVLDSSTSKSPQYLPLADRLTCKVLDIIAENCPNLAEIKLVLYDLTTEDMFATYFVNLATRCAKLKKVHLWNANELDDETLLLFLRECSSLEYFSLRGNNELTDKWVGALNEKLKGFYIFGYPVESNTVIEQLLKKCDSIEELNYSSYLESHELMRMVTYYKNTLTKLFVPGHVMKPHEWYELSDVLQNLELLVLSNTRGIDNVFLKLLSEKCKKLKALDISRTLVGDDGVSALASLPYLKALDVSSLLISGEGVKVVAREGRLVSFYFGCVYEFKGNLIEESLISIAKFCPNIRRVDVVCNEAVTNRLVEEFVSSLERGFLKGPISMHVKYTKVNENVPSHPKLKLLRTNASHSVFHEVFYAGQ